MLRFPPNQFANIQAYSAPWLTSNLCFLLRENNGQTFYVTYCSTVIYK